MRLLNQLINKMLSEIITIRQRLHQMPELDHLLFSSKPMLANYT